MLRNWEYLKKNFKFYNFDFPRFQFLSEPTENLLDSPYFIKLITCIQKKPSMSFIEDYRKILRRRIKEYYWNDIQTEIESFFAKIQSVTIPDSAKFCLKKFTLSQKEILDKFD